MTSQDHHHIIPAGCCASGASAAGKAEDVVRDPVCGMTVDPAAGKPSTEHDGHVYHFCCASCRDKFVKDPEAYLTAIDPVCGMNVDRATAKHFARHEGQGFYFCSAGCKAQIRGGRREKYLGGRPAARADAGGHAIHLPDASGDRARRARRLPDLRHGAGADGRADRRRGPNPELVDFTRRLLGQRGCCRVPLLLIAMGPMVGLPLRDWIGEPIGDLARAGAGDAGGAVGGAARSSAAAANRSSTAAPTCGR